MSGISCLHLKTLFQEHIGAKLDGNQMQWEHPVGQGFLECRSKFWGYTEDSYGQHVLNLLKIGDELNHLFQLNSAAILSLLIGRIFFTLNICFAEVKNSLNNLTAQPLLDCHPWIWVSLRTKNLKPCLKFIFLIFNPSMDLWVLQYMNNRYVGRFQEYKILWFITFSCPFALLYS